MIESIESVPLRRVSRHAGMDTNAFWHYEMERKEGSLKGEEEKLFFLHSHFLIV